MALATFVAIVASSLGPSTTQAAQPNVLVVVSDDERTDEMSVMPHVRHFFADQGTSYSSAYVTPLCCPSRSSIFSGRYPHNTGVWDNFNSANFDPWFSLQRVLRAAGYHTGIVGKYLNGISALDAPYFDFRAELDDNAVTEQKDAPALVQQFFAGAPPDRPWFLYFASNDPHGPWVKPPPRGAAIPPFSPAPSYGEEDLSDKDNRVRHRASLFDPARAEDAYYGQYAESERLDLELGKIFQIVGQHKAGRPLIAVFMSDNGFQWGEHGLTEKQWPYLESVHVPLIVRWGGHLAPGAADSRIVGGVDIAPTIFEATGADPGYLPDGHSLLAQPRNALLIDGASQWWEAQIRANREYIHWADGWIEDYELTSDPWQLTASNIADPAIEDWLAKASTCAGADCP